MSQIIRFFTLLAALLLFPAWLKADTIILNQFASGTCQGQGVEYNRFSTGGCKEYGPMDDYVLPALVCSSATTSYQILVYNNMNKMPGDPPFFVDSE
ncbi:hypothetical protein HDU89_008973 [Geranomyces variabilis]|nr:hypothetical protein HDU89_008973 [Geranomyces variabilis]